MTTLTTTTRLEAINLMLRGIGEAPVNDLNTTDLLDVANASATLDSVNREVQSEGFKFNTRYDWPLNADIDGYIDAPSDTLKCYSMPGREFAEDFVLEGFRLYDRKNNTDVWTVSQLKVKIVFYRDFETLPECARNYIAIRAARRFQAESLTAVTLSQLSQEAELRARARLLDEQGEALDANILTGTYAMQNAIGYRRYI